MFGEEERGKILEVDFGKLHEFFSASFLMLIDDKLNFESSDNGMERDSSS